MEASAATQHHVHDVGRILLQAQTDLKKVREALSGDGVSREAQNAGDLQQVVERVETELRLKAEAVLKTVVQGSVSTLPILGAFNFRSAPASSELLDGVSTQPLHQIRRDPGARLLLPKRTRSAGAPPLRAPAINRHAAAMVDPGAAANRRYMQEKYGIKEPGSSGQPSRPMGQKVLRGKLHKVRCCWSPPTLYSPPRASACTLCRFSTCRSAPSHKTLSCA